VSTPTIFGPIISADQLEGWVQQTLESWWTTYAREYELQQGMPEDSLPEPRSWVVAEEVERESADQLPAIVIVSPGLNGDRPIQEGSGTFDATWLIGVGIFCSATTRNDTTKLVRQYGAIIRSIMLQKQTLGGNANGTTWMDESYNDEFNFTDDLTISAGQVIFEVQVADVANRYGGPADPAPDTAPGSQWPEVEETFIDIERKEDQ
jgi:hypothetical protein